MKKGVFFFLLFFVLSWTFKVHAQTFTASLDSLVSTFAIKNKKAVLVQPPATAAYAQKNAADLVYILDQFFNADHYKKNTSVKVIQYFINAELSIEGVIVDSFKSVVYILDIPGTISYHKLQTGTFQKVPSRPTKVPEQFYLSRLKDGRLILVGVVSFLYKDEVAALKRSAHIQAYLDWLLHKYQ
ncbi:MAG: hypothetical protein EOP54_00995 [Sphingobacteriales bacterium]|nr:MAG: hypothetical protein EOP54_00995 [Sphingobacteriales bacterium]